MRLFIAFAAFIVFASARGVQELPIKIPDIPLIPIPDIPLPVDIKDLNLDKIKQTFGDFRKNYGKKYKNSGDESKAQGIFGDNLKKIIQLNMKHKGKSIKFGLNRFSDLTDSEFASKILMKEKPSSEFLTNFETYNFTSTKFQAQPSFDWRDTPNVVGPVRFQDTCGCCWAFTTAALVQSAYGIKNQEIIQPSEQQLCDCGLQNAKPGCNGGNVGVALTYVQNNGVSLDDSYYPYTAARAMVGGVCEDSDKPNNIKIASYQSLHPSNAEKIQSALVSTGPIAVAYKVGSSFRHYKSGVFDSNDCDDAATLIGWHAVAVVGYGDDGGVPYWIAKNSWDTTFGDQGYFRFIRGTDLCQFESADAFSATI